MNGLLAGLVTLFAVLSGLGGTAHAWDEPEPDYWNALSTAPELAFGGIGVAGTPTLAGTAFDQLLDDILLDDSQALDLLAHGSPAGRLYAAALLWHRDTAAGRAALTALTRDPSELTYIAGCMVETTTVGQIAQRFLSANALAYLETR